MFVQSFQHCKPKRIIALAIIICFITTTFMPPAVAQVLNMPVPGTMVGVSPAYVPVLLKGLHVHPKNPLLLDFILDTGKSDLKVADKAFKDESQKLVKYFLTALTVKEENLWVNLSPLEQDRMIPADLGQTEMGRDMLAQDYLLKQLTASLFYPEKELGQAFWDKVYAQAKQQLGSTDIPVDTFNKVWIVADKAKVLERDNAAYVVGAHLKVLLDADYAALQSHTDASVTENKAQTLAAQVIRDIILPAIEKEVNEGQNFAALRQIFHAMILSTWYKLALKEALLNQVYSDQSKTAGVLAADPSVKEQIYANYLQAYKKGVFDFIKDDVTDNNTPLPRRYFSGGEVFANLPNILDRAQTASPAEKAGLKTGDLAMASVQIAGTTEGAKPNTPMNVYGNFYATFGAMDRQLQQTPITQEDVGNFSLKFLTSNAEMLPPDQRRLNETWGVENEPYGVTEVYFVPQGDIQKRMVAFQTQLKRLLGNKVALIDEDKLHFTTQSLEQQWDDKNKGTKKPYVLHSGLDQIDINTGAILSVRQKARSIKTNAVKMQVARLNFNPQTGIFWELRPYVADATHDPIMERRKAWGLPTPRPPHITAAYFTQPLTETEQIALRALLAAYRDVTHFGDIWVDEVQVIAYTNFAFNASEYDQGYIVLERVALKTDEAMTTDQVSELLGQPEPRIEPLDAEAVNSQIERMYSDKYPPLNISFFGPGEKIQAEIARKVLEPLRRAVSAEILDLPPTHHIHLTVADKNEEGFLREDPAEPEVFNNFVDAVDKVASGVPSFKGRINGRIFLAPDGVVVWWIDDINFVNWVNNVLRKAFSGENFAPKKIVAINLGRIKKSGMNEEQLADVETLINRVLKDFLGKGSFAPEAELEISSVTVGQRKTPGWTQAYQETVVSLGKVIEDKQSDRAQVSAAQLRLQAFLGKAKNIWVGITSSVTEGIQNSAKNKAALAANKAGFDIPRGQDKPFFGVAALLDDKGYQDYFASVQDVIAEELGVKAELQEQRALKAAHTGEDDQEDAVLIRTSAAMFVPPGGEHVTLASNVMQSWTDAEAVTRDLRDDTRHMGSFSLQVEGPQMMTNLGITIKLTTRDPQALIVKERSLARAEARKVPSAMMPPFFHSSVAYLTNATDEQIARINARLQNMPDFKEDVSVRRLAVEMGSIGRKEAQHVGPVVDLSREAKENLPTVLDAAKVNTQVGFMYTGGFSPLHVVVQPGADLQQEIEPLLRDLRAAVSEDVLEVPAVGKLHWSGVDKWALGVKKPQARPVDPQGFQDFVEEVKWSATSVAPFEGPVRGRLYLSDNGVVVWWMEAAAFNAWMKNQLRGAFPESFDANTVVTMSLGRIKKADLSADVLADIETKINTVIARYMTEGEFAPKAVLTVASVFASQGAMTAWATETHEQRIPLGVTIQSDAAMQADMGKIFAVLKEALTGQETLAAYAQEFVDKGFSVQDTESDSEIDARWFVRQSLQLYGKNKQWPSGLMQAVERHIMIVRDAKLSQWNVVYTTETQDLSWLDVAFSEKLGARKDWQTYTLENPSRGDLATLGVFLKNVILSFINGSQEKQESVDTAMLSTMREKIVFLQNLKREDIIAYLDRENIQGEERTKILDVLTAVGEISADSELAPIYHGIVERGWTKDEFEAAVKDIEIMLNETLRLDNVVITNAAKKNDYIKVIANNLLWSALIVLGATTMYSFKMVGDVDVLAGASSILILALLPLIVSNVKKLSAVGKNETVPVQEQKDIAAQFVAEQGKAFLTGVRSKEDTQKALKEKLVDWLDTDERLSGYDLVVVGDAIMKLLNVVKVAATRYDIELRDVPSTPSDAAMQADIKGGIDLNAAGMDLAIDKDGLGVAMSFDPAMVADFRKGNFTGVEGIILRIVPLASFALN